MNSRLKLLQKALNRYTEGASVRTLAVDTGADLSTIYRRLEALRKAGAEIAEVDSTWEKSGPVPKKFVLMKAAS